MARIDFDAERATLASEPLEFILFERHWHSPPPMTLGEKRALTRRLTEAQSAGNADEAIDAVLNMLGTLVVPAEREDFIALMEEKGDEALALRVMERLVEAHSGRPTRPPNGSRAPSSPTSQSSTDTAQPVP